MDTVTRDDCSRLRGDLYAKYEMLNTSLVGAHGKLDATLESIRRLETKLDKQNGRIGLLEEIRAAGEQIRQRVMEQIKSNSDQIKENARNIRENSVQIESNAKLIASGQGGVRALVWSVATGLAVAGFGVTAFWLVFRIMQIKFQVGG